MRAWFLIFVISGIVGLIPLHSGLAATTRASGTFVAKEDCDLYQSKRRKTNPGNLRAEPERSYAIREAILSEGTLEWVRVETGASRSPQRWILASCGETMDFVAGGSSGGARRDGSCSEPDQYDSHVLAISWQPAFCESKRDKAECRALNSAAGADFHVGTHFALHGLWPNKRGCGTRYGFCGTVRSRPGGGFCNYPEVELTDEVRERLARVMPSVDHGTCLQRHEWWKHGTCRTSDANEYYSLAVALLRQINESSFVLDFIQENIGGEVERDELHAAFDAAFGAEAHQRIRLVCSAGRLGEIQLSLPRDLDPDDDIEELLAQGDPTGGGRCRTEFQIDAAGLDS